MVVIRLNRGGSKARPFFNIVVADKRCLLYTSDAADD